MWIVIYSCCGKARRQYRTMALWIRGGKNPSWTLHLQPAQWVVLVTTNFSLSLSLMLLTWSSELGSFSSIILLTSAFLKGLSFLSHVWPASFFRLVSRCHSFLFCVRCRVCCAPWELQDSAGLCSQTSAGALVGKVLDYSEQGATCWCGQRATGP